jgi:hypothetical protein
MGKPNPKILKFMEAYKVDADEVWEVRPGIFAIKHSALERIASEQKITFDAPMMLEFHASDKIAVLCVTGKQGDRSEWSIGEAAPYNNKNTYPFAMAEKRGKDRVILKLLNSHGALYSEDEADDFKRPGTHVTRPEDIGPVTQYDEHGQPIDNIPLGDDGIRRMTKAQARPEYAALQHEMRQNKTPEQLLAWSHAARNRVSTLPADWDAIIRGQYEELKNELSAAIREVA